MLPSHGTCFSIFNLANSIRYSPAAGIKDWISAAESRSSFLAGALDHLPAAEFLISAGLVKQSDGIRPTGRLRGLSEKADATTLIAIAAMLLRSRPPAWLHSACAGSNLQYELIPSPDLRALSWLEPYLPEVLLGAARALKLESTSVRSRLGYLGELVVMDCLKRQSARPVHLSRVSDHFGFDIESRPPFEGKWEVKACLSTTAGAFHLSRNEFEKSQQMLDKWRLVQVEFSPTVLKASCVCSDHVVGINELSARQLAGSVVPDTPEFSWEESAKVRPPAQTWSSSWLEVSRDLGLPGIWDLGDLSPSLSRQYF
ncbi:DUF3883 domain-containing protein [Dietzia sp. DQ11-71]|nr:DUF3883 domain-containing protein [Dietzia sp. DQ11-71]